MEIILIIIVIIAGLAVYFLPTIIGWKKKSSEGILLLNLFLGWTFLGWLGALIWAVSSETEQQRWTYTCPKCGFKNELNQKVRIYVCPQCKTETVENSERKTKADFENDSVDGKKLKKEWTIDNRNPAADESAWDWLTKRNKKDS